MSESLALRSVPDELLTRQELARVLRCHVSTVDRYRAEGMPCVPWGRRLVRFRLREVLAWSEQHYGKVA